MMNSKEYTVLKELSGWVQTEFPVEVGRNESWLGEEGRGFCFVDAGDLGEDIEVGQLGAAYVGKDPNKTEVCGHQTGQS